LEAALQSNPDFVVANHLLGRLLLVLGRDDDALRRLRAAVPHAPYNAACRFDLALALHRAGQDEEAKREIGEGLRLNKAWPGQTLRTVRRALASADLLPPYLIRDAVVSAREASLALEDQDPQALDVLAQALAAAGQHDEAVATLEKAVERARATGDRDQLLRSQERLELFRKKKP
jgi:Flp pilus assembly protein TadD